MTVRGAIVPPHYKSQKIPFIYTYVIHVINLLFHGAFDENVFIPIRAHQDGLERRERHPGRVQQDKS